jgi:hypothetical protein
LYVAEHKDVKAEVRCISDGGIRKKSKGLTIVAGKILKRWHTDKELVGQYAKCP